LFVCLWRRAKKRKVVCYGYTKDAGSVEGCRSREAAVEGMERGPFGGSQGAEEGGDEMGGALAGGKEHEADNGVEGGEVKERLPYTHSLLGKDVVGETEVGRGAGESGDEFGRSGTGGWGEDVAAYGTGGSRNGAQD
jgi:hypothetical protein